jgi:hypothetical protein
MKTVIILFYLFFCEGFYGEVAGPYDGTTIATKTHQHDLADVSAFANGSAILLIRNPFKAILSFHNFLFGGHTGYAPAANFFRKGLGQLIFLIVFFGLHFALLFEYPILIVIELHIT